MSTNTLNDNYTNILEKQVLTISKLSLPNELSNVIIEKLKNVVLEERQLENLQRSIEIDLKAYEGTHGWGNINNKYQKIKAEKNLEEMINFEKKDLRDWIHYVALNYNMGGSRRNKLNHADMNMKEINELCKANQIKLSRVVNNKRVVYTKKELITKLKRKKII